MLIKIYIHVYVNRVDIIIIHSTEKEVQTKRPNQARRQDFLKGGYVDV